MNVDLKDKFLGTRHFSAEELADNGYVLNFYLRTGVDDLCASACYLFRFCIDD